MSYAAKSDEGKIRIRFENLSKRLSKIDVDIIHKKTDSVSLLATKSTPDSGELGCFFLDEIDRLRTLDTAPMFKKLCFELGNLSQSLPELLHHQQKVINLLAKYLNDAPPNTLRSVFSLISVLGRDLKEDMNPYFHVIFGALVKAVPAVAMSGGTTPNDCIPNPELTGKLFETVSYLLRANLATLTEQPDELSAYYGALLGSSVDFVRKFAAKSFIIVFRKLSTSVFKTHVKKLVKAVSQNFKAALDNDLSLLLLEDYEQLDKSKQTAGVRRTKCLLEGLSLLFFYTFKGIRGQAHSKAAKRVQSLHQLMLALFASNEEDPKNGKKKAKPTTGEDSLAFTWKCYSAILYRVQFMLHRHLYFQTQGEILTLSFEFIQEIIQKTNDAHSVVLKNVLAETGGKMLFMLLTVANGRVLRDESVKQAAMPRILDLAMRMTQWTSAQSQIEESTVIVAQNVLIRAWHLFPQNTALSARSAELLTPALNRSLRALSADDELLDETLKETALLRYADGFVNQLPGPIVGKCVLPVLAKGLLSLKKELSYDKWISLTLQFLFRIKDFRENTDDFLQLSGGADDEENDGEGEDEEEDEELLSDDEIDSEQDDDNEKGEKPKAPQKGNSAEQKKLKKQEKEREKKLKALQTKKKDQKRKKSILRSGISKETAQIAAKFLYAIDSFPLLLKELRSYIVKELKKKDFFSSASQSDLSLSLLSLSWFGNCLPDLLFGTDSETQLLSSLSELLKKTAKDFDALSAAEGFESVLSHLLQAFVLLSSKKLASKEGNELRTLHLQWIKTLSLYVQRVPTSISTLSAFFHMLQSFRVSIENTPQDFLSQLLSKEESERLISSLAVAVASPSFWLRVYAVRVLGFFSPPTDNDNANTATKSKDSSGETSASHVFDIAALLLEILRLPIHLSVEREILRRLEVLEVWCRGEKLLGENVSFLKVVIGFALGLFHVKFKSLWSAAIGVLHSIASSAAGEEVLWPMFCAALARAQSASAPTTAATKTFVYGKAHTELVVLTEDAEQLDLHVCLSMLATHNRGEIAFSLSEMRSVVFPMKLGTRTNQLAMQPDARTDQESVCLMLLELLKKSPAITLKRSKTIVPAFLLFLESQYYRAFSEEPELLPLTLLGLFAKREGDENDTQQQGEIPLLSRRAIRQRLDAFLSIFAAVPSPKQLFKHNLLFALFHELVCKPDLAVAKLAFECIATYKPLYVTPYRDSIKRMFDDKTLRNELLVLVIDRPRDEERENDTKETVVKEEHKADLFPLLIRILFGRLLAKPSSKRGGDRDQNTAKRTAVLSFIAKMDGSFAKHFLHLMMRGVLLDYLDVEKERACVDASESKAVQDYLSEGYTKVSDHVTMAVAEHGFRRISWERFQGFLFLLEPVISLLGFRLTKYLVVLQELLMQMLILSHSSREKSLLELRELNDVEEVVEEDEKNLDNAEEEGEDDEEEHGEEQAAVVEANAAAQTLKLAKFSSAVRSMVLSRFSEMVEIFHSVHDFAPIASRLFAHTQPLLLALKSAVVGARKLPALLSLISQLALHSNTVRIVSSDGFVLEQVIQCVSTSVLSPEVGKTVFAVLGAVLDVDGGAAIAPFAETIVHCFTRRFQGKTESSAMTELKLSDVVVSNIGGARIELQLLCRLAEEIFVREDIAISTRSASNLATLVLGLLRGYTNSRKVRVMDDWVISILRIYKSLLWRIEDVSSHTAFFSRLFGPTQHSGSLFNQPSVRQELVAVYAQLAQHQSVSRSLSVALVSLRGMTRPDGAILESRDYNTFIPVMQGLSKTETESETSEGEREGEERVTWSSLLGPQSYARRENNTHNAHTHRATTRAVSTHMTLCAAPVFEAIRCLSDNELAVRAAAAPALKALITCSLQWYEEHGKAEDWLTVLVAVLIPALRRGVQSSADHAKSGFLAVFAHLVKAAQSLPVPLPLSPTQTTQTHLLSSSESFHRDLGFLLHEDPEQDFFENIAHIQLHRRARAFMRLKVFLQHQFTVLREETGEETEREGEKTEFSAEEKEKLLKNRISTSSFVHILLPIAFHYFVSDEFVKKLNQNLLNDVVSFVGAVALHLPWNHYHSLFKRTLKLLERASEAREKTMQTVLCAVLDAFRFDIATRLAVNNENKKNNMKKSEIAAFAEGEGEEVEDEENKERDEDAEGEGEGEDEENATALAPVPVIESEHTQLLPLNDNKGDDEEEPHRTIASVVVKSVLPAVKAHLIKTVKDHHGDKTDAVQTNIALALANLIKRLAPPAVAPQIRANLFTNLVISVVNTLKSKDSAVRDAARHCLAKIVRILGLNTLKTVVYELQSILREGYQKHVSLYTVKYLLNTVLDGYTPDDAFPSLDLEELSKEGALSVEELLARRPPLPALDEAIPLIMQSVLDDLSEETKQDREAEGGVRTNVMREMKGSKFCEILETTARCLLFRPTFALLAVDDPTRVSSIHAVSSPLLQALHRFYEQNYFGNTSTEHFQTLSGRVAEALQRVAQGVAKNASVKDKELLLYLHATLQPFVVSMLADYRRYRAALGEISQGAARATGRSEKKQKRLKAAAQPGVGGASANLTAVLGEGEAGLKSLFGDGDEDDFELDLPSYLRGDEDSDDENDQFESERNPKKRARERDALRTVRAAQWLPREWKNAPSSKDPNGAASTGNNPNGGSSTAERKAVLAERDRVSVAQFKVQDGASAPRLTGRNRYDLAQQRQRNAVSSTTGIDKSTLIAIKYCLTLLHAALKRDVFSAHSDEIQAMLLPFVPLLRSFLYIPGAAEVVALTVKCIAGLLSWGLRLEERVFSQLTNRVLLLMLQSGKAMVSKDSELCQACLQCLVVCFKRYNTQCAANSNGAPAVAFPLNELKVRVLVEMMTVSLMEITSNYQHPAFALIKEIIAAKIVLPEIYDLVETLTQQIVVSHRKGVRDMASSIAVQFLLVYPMAKPRFESHLQLCIKNASYEFEEGRVSALETLLLLIRSFPVPVVEEYAHVLFLPMTLKLVNEKAHKCREVVVNVLIALMKKIQSKDLLTTFQDFSVKWLHSYLSYSKSAADGSAVAARDERQSAHNAISLMKVGAQVVGVFFKARPDLWSSRVEYIREVIAMAHENIIALLESYRQSSERGSALDQHKGEIEENDAERVARVSKSDMATGHWNAFYHLLLLVDTLYVRSPASTDHVLSLAATDSEANKNNNKKIKSKGESFMKVLLQDLLLFPHVWVRSVSLRILESYFKRRPVAVTAAAGRISPFDDALHCEVLEEKNMLYHAGRRLAIMLNQPLLPAALEDSAVHATLYVMRTMLVHPQLDTFTGKAGAVEGEEEELATGEDGLEDADEVVARDNDNNEDEQESEGEEEDVHKVENKYLSMIQKNHKQIEAEDDENDDEEEDEDSEEDEDNEAAGVSASSEKDENNTSKRGISWMVHRLRAIGADIRGNRRRHVLKVLHALVKAQSVDTLTPYLPQILEVPIRIMLSKTAVDHTDEEQAVAALKEEATELLRHVEHKMGAIEFMAVFSEIQRKVEKIKHDKKRRMKAEAVSNPALYAQKKIKRQEQKKQSQKRKVAKHMAIKGLKRRAGNDN